MPEPGGAGAAAHPTAEITPPAAQRAERRCNAALRALAAAPRARWHGRQLTVDGRPAPLYAPHLAADARTDPLPRCRGVTDSMALRLRLSDRACHLRHDPDDAVARMLFDTLEQLRVESIAPPQLLGVRPNVEHAHTHWRREWSAARGAENEAARLVFGVIQWARAHLSRVPQEDGVVHSVRTKLAPLIGEAMAQLAARRHDQAQFTTPARFIATTVADLVATVAGEVRGAARRRPVVPLGWLPPDATAQDQPTAGAATPTTAAYPPSHYHIHTTEFDRRIHAAQLHRRARRATLGRELERRVAAQGVNLPRLAWHLQRVFAAHSAGGWALDRDEGYIDGRRLSQLVAHPGFRRVFKAEKPTPGGDAVVVFLVDNSGSMKHHHPQAVAAWVDLCCRALQLAGVQCELLGFTTGAWGGGRALQHWRRHGMPPHPGRINERLHIIYKDADTPWQRARHAISALLDPLHFREGLAGEALLWARDRLRTHRARRKCLLLISDGAPMDAATARHNHAGYLEQHLSAVVQQIAAEGEIELAAMGVDQAMGDDFRRAVTVDLSAPWGNRIGEVMEGLFAPREYGRR